MTFWSKSTPNPFHSHDTGPGSIFYIFYLPHENMYCSGLNVIYVMPQSLTVKPLKSYKGPQKESIIFQALLFQGRSGKLQVCILSIDSPFFCTLDAEIETYVTNPPQNITETSIQDGPRHLSYFTPINGWFKYMGFTEEISPPFRWS